jgi:hypothetical protein
MNRFYSTATLALLLTSTLGCSVCCTPFDDAYPTYGGKWQRTNRFHGRVGSAFDPAGEETIGGPSGQFAPEGIEGQHEPTLAEPMDETMVEELYFEEE